MSQEHPNDNLQPTQLTAHEHGASSANNNNNAYSANGQQHDWTEAYNQFKQQVERNVQQQGFLSASLNGGGSTDDAQILRVNQLDAERLDEEIKRYLFFYFSKIFAFFDVRSNLNCSHSRLLCCRLPSLTRFNQRLAPFYSF